MDVFGLTNKPQFNWVFYSNGSTNSWQTWQKPPNCKFVSFFLIGGGAGGNGGTGTAGTNRAGGGGGGGSSITRGLYPAIVLPDILYIQVGLGGIGGSSSTLGTSGTLSYVCLEPITTNIADLLLASGGVAAANGATIGAGGNAGTIFSQASTIPGNLGLLTLTAGSNGSAGGTGAVNGSSVTPTIITTGGAGGGGSSTANANGAGGSILATTVTQQITGGLAGATTEASSGVFTQLPSIDTSSTILPMFFTGGAGGGGNGAATGGRGGNGSYGSGGGGGGAGTAASGGRGGDGGNGLVIITAW